MRVGTRGSNMALAQTRLVCQALKDAALAQGVTLEIDECSLKTCGDKWQGTEKASSVDKKKWTGALEEALCKREVDIVVHSGKDVPAEFDEATGLCSVLRRSTAEDAFIGKLIDGKRTLLASLTANSTIGTASLRRQTQLYAMLPGVSVVPHRGNVPTRISKLDVSNNLDGIVVAAAGLERLGISRSEYEIIPAAAMLPAVNQGTLVVQYRREDKDIARLLSAVQDKNTEISFVTERRVVTQLDAGCHSAIGVFATLNADNLKLFVKIVGLESGVIIEHCEEGNADNWKQVADKMLDYLHSKDANKVLQEAELEPRVSNGC